MQTLPWFIISLLYHNTYCYTIENKIIGGFVASQEVSKHQISLRAKYPDLVDFGSGHFCGGSLISSSLVLTAAHCLLDADDNVLLPSYLVVVGGSTKRTDKNSNTFVAEILKLIIHEHYNPVTFENDIALLLLKNEVPKDHLTLQPIKLLTTSPPANTLCQVTGWGATVWEGNHAPDDLMAVNVSTITVELCNSVDSYNGIIKDGMICAGDMNGGKDSCQGDSGGPLVCNGQLAAVVSFGFECAKPLFPGVYSDVAYYYDWISKNDAAKRSPLSQVLILLSIMFAAFRKCGLLM